MTCRELADFIMDYLAGDLPRNLHLEFEEHLGVCPNCQRYLAGYEAATRLGQRAFEDDEQSATEAGVPTELIDAILAAKATTRE